MKCVIDEEDIDYRLIMSTLKVYNMLQYKKLIFEIIPKIMNKEEVENPIYIKFSDIFEFVYDKVYIEYKIEDNKIKLDILNRELFDKLHATLLKTYKGVPIISDEYISKVDFYYNFAKVKLDLKS